MRLGHADGEEEGLTFLLERTERLRGEARGLPVGIGVVGDVSRLDGGSAGAALLVDVRRIGDHLERGLGSVGRRLGGFPRHGPARGIVEAAMEDLAHGLAMVAVILEMVRDRDGVGEGLAEMRLKVPHAGGVRTTAGHERGARRAAHGLLAIGAVEGGATGSDAIEVRGLGQIAS